MVIQPVRCGPSSGGWSSEGKSIYLYGDVGYGELGWCDSLAHYSGAVRQAIGLAAEARASGRSGSPPDPLRSRLPKLPPGQHEARRFD